MVHGDDARESPTVVGHGECGARGHAAELGRRLFRHGFCVDFCRGVVFWVSHSVPHFTIEPLLGTLVNNTFIPDSNSALLC